MQGLAALILVRNIHFGARLGPVYTQPPSFTVRAALFPAAVVFAPRGAVDFSSDKCEPENSVFELYFTDPPPSPVRSISHGANRKADGLLPNATSGWSTKTRYSIVSGSAFQCAGLDLLEAAYTHCRTIANNTIRF